MSEHGGDIYRNKVNIDFSVNTSPYGIPPMVKASVDSTVLNISSYPDPLYEDLREAIAKADGILRDQVVCGNGASELIYTCIKALSNLMNNNRHVSFLIPCFNEYEKAAKAARLNINKVSLEEDNDFLPYDEDINKLIENAGIVILGNPNNPTGRLLEKEWLKKLIKRADEENTYIILDETFLPLTEHEDDYADISANNLIKIRAYTKSMAIPGVRIGYAICSNRKLLDEIKLNLPDWNVSVIAEQAGISCAQSKEWLKEKIFDRDNGISALREKLSNNLTELGINVFKSEANYILIKSDINLYEELLEKKILIRDCENFEGLKKGYYRIAVKSQKENEYLIRAIKERVNLSKNISYTSKEDLLSVKPNEIEKLSFEILSGELELKGVNLDIDKAPIIKRCIHTTADFQYATTLTFSENAVRVMKDLIRNGACIVTDTNMALAGINKKELSKYGGEAYCFMADPDIAKISKERECTRATASMEYAASLGRKIIFVVGNAPTALVTLCEMYDRGEFTPEFIVGVPVGFVNVEQAKEMVINRNINYIVNRGRKGGSNVAAAIVNAILYSMRDE